MLKFGIIAEFDATKGLAKVQFAENDIVTKWLPIMVKKSFSDKYSYHFDVNEHVACLMDENTEEGVILGAIYNEADTPSDQAGKNITRVDFEDGPFLSYDREAKELTAEIEDVSVLISPDIVEVKHGDTEFTLSSSGISIVKAGESLKTLLDDLLTEILAETHPTGTGPSGPPTNAANYSAIKQRIPQLFEN